MKRTMKKLLICILIVTLLNSFFISNVQAADLLDPFEDFISTAMNTVVGILTYPIRLIANTLRIGY